MEATDKRIPHSELVKWANMQGLGQISKQSLIALTRNGVYPEGAELGKAATTNQAIMTDAIANLKEKSSANGFRFGAASNKELMGVRQELIDVAKLALTYTGVDFCVFDGLRTEAEQRELLKRGVTKTLKSKHMTGDAIDLVPYRNGKPVWEWELIYHVALAVDEAATDLGYANKIRWGGAWDRVLSDFGGDAIMYRREVEDYCKRHPGKDFIDGPHWEWVG